MNVGALEALFRDQFHDKVKPYLVTEESFLEYLNEANEEACIRSSLIYDRTSDVCTLNISSGEEYCVIDESIYSIIEAFVTSASGDKTKLVITDRIELDRLRPFWRDDTGTPEYIIQYDDHIEFSPTPDEAVTINIECHMLPYELTGDASIPQISRSNHRKLLHWVHYRSYAVQDSEVFDKQKSGVELGLFTNVFGNRPTANNNRNKYANREHRNKACY